MPILNFDEPSRSSRKGVTPITVNKPLKLILGIGALAGVIALGSTLAANIGINTGAPIEFGQGVAQTTSCDSQVTLTPISTFVNADGAGEFKFTGVTLSGLDTNEQIADNSLEGCAGKIFAIKIYNGQGALNATSYLINVGVSEFTSSAGTFSNLLNYDSSNTSVTLTFDPAIIAATDVYRITIESSVATVYTVGQTGPGGGIVFYVSANFFTSTGSTCGTKCKYLEVAPSTWQSAGASVADDSIYNWSTNFLDTTGQDIATGTSEGFSVKEKANWKIGQGFSNTYLVNRSANATSEAQIAVLAYAGTDASTGQWFIPSMNELNELCKYARGQITGDLTVACVTGNGSFKSTANAGTDHGGFVENYYWSSSESDAVFAGVQGFDGGGQGRNNKDFKAPVRPVRAF